MKKAWVASCLVSEDKTKNVIGVYSQRKKGRKAIREWIKVVLDPGIFDQKISTDSTKKSRIKFFKGEELIATLDRYNVNS
jgi:hypothetical protein